MAEPGSPAQQQCGRCAAALPLSDVAVSAGVDWLRPRDHLHALKPRGACAAAAAAVVVGGETQQILDATQRILDALNSRACSPHATRAAIGYGSTVRRNGGSSLRVRGTACRLSSRLPLRRVIPACAGNRIGWLSSTR